MNILILATKFSLNKSTPYLTNELADALTEKKCRVTILLLDWSANDKNPCTHDYIDHSGQKIVVISPLKINSPIKFLNTLIKWSLASVVMRQKFNQILEEGAFDCLISFSPSSIMAGFMLGNKRISSIQKILIQWDFFPFHHRQIGVINSRLIELIAATIENKTIQSFNWIACMSKKNVEYLLSHYTINKKQTVSILPIWTKVKKMLTVDKVKVRAKYNLDIHSSIAVFGGQLVKGRGFDDIVDAAKFFCANKSDVQIVIVGSGLLWNELFLISKDLFPYLILIPAMSRDEYKELLSAADIGIVATVRNVDVPTFPSKCLDYMATGLPIVASVEKTTDFGEFIINNNCGLVCEAGDIQKFAENIIFLSSNPDLAKKLGDNGRKTLCDQMDVNLIAGKIIDFISNKNSLGK